jgi:hypothetical protein
MYTLTLTQNEFKAVVNLLDLGVKAIGLGAVTPEALAIRGKLEAATLAPPVTEEKEGEQ